MHNDLNIHELITLYLDGESSPQEEQQLFTALAHDTLLQEEFRYAVQMKTLLQPEPELVPPEADAALFARLGMVEEERRRVLPFLPWWNSSVVRFAAVAAMLVALIGGGSMMWKSGQESMDNGQLAMGNSGKTIDNSRESMDNGQLAMGNGEKTIDNGQLAVDHEQKRVVDSEKRVVDGEKRVVDGEKRVVDGEKIIATTQTPMVKTQELVARNEQLEHQNTKEVESKESVGDDKSKQSLGNNERQLLAPVPFMAPALVPATKPDEKTNVASLPFLQPTVKVEQTAVFSPVTPSRFLVEARGGQSFATNQQVHVSNTVALTGLYRLSSSDWIGVVAGRDLGKVDIAALNISVVSAGSTSLDGKAENIPGNRNVKTAEEATRIQDSVSAAISKTWVGAVYEKRFGEVLRHLQPSTRFVAGSYGSDPFGKVGAGLLYHFGGGIRGSLGVEGTLVFEKASTQRSLGAVCGVAVEF